MYEMILNGLKQNSNIMNNIEQPVNNNLNSYNATDQQCVINNNGRKLFSINDFIHDISDVSAKKNQSAHFHSNNINSYDIANTCIRQTFFRILNYPTISYRDVWLPVLMRSALGNAVHDFVQNNSSTFTESEISMKVPSLRTSVRIDCLINDDVLVEIKSCPYSDYGKILNSQSPRDSDFYQAVYYRWLLNNHIDEIRSQPKDLLRTQPPALSKYNIKTIQFIYVAHDLIASDITSMTEAIKYVTNLKKILNSKHNKFFNMHTLTLDLDHIDMIPYENYVIEKLNTINYFLNSNTPPPMTNKFINPSSCFFCLYKDTCKGI